MAKQRKQRMTGVVTADDLMEQAATVLRQSARKPGLPVPDSSFQEAQMYTATRKVRLAARMGARG